MDFTDIAILVINVLGLFCGVGGVLVGVTRLRDALLDEGVMARFFKEYRFSQVFDPAF